MSSVQRTVVAWPPRENHEAYWLSLEHIVTTLFSSLPHSYAEMNQRLNVVDLLVKLDHTHKYQVGLELDIHFFLLTVMISNVTHNCNDL